MTHTINRARTVMPALALTLALVACSGGGSRGATDKPIENAQNVVAAPAPEWAKAATIYEVNVRQGTAEGTL